jgi:hypothetical protein
MTIDDTYIVDTGTTIIGIYSVKQRKFRQFQFDRLRPAAERILRVREFVTYCGHGPNAELTHLAEFLGIARSELDFGRRHIDMRDHCWPTMERGPSQRDTYDIAFGKGSYQQLIDRFGDTYEGDNRRDVHMTRQLWLLWKKGELRARLDK